MSIIDELIEEKKDTDTEEVTESQEKEEKSEEQENFSEMLDQNFIDTDKLVEGDVVEGKVIAINEDYIFVSLGGKHEAYAEVEEYQSKTGKTKVNIGDTLRGFVVKKTDSDIVISKSLNRKYVDKGFLKNAFEDKIPIKGKIVSTMKGGFSVEVLGTRAFCPFAQSDIRFVSDPSSMVGSYYEFVIIEISSNMKNIVLSRKALLEKEQEKLKKETMSNLNIGDTITGTVSRIADFGAFIDLGGIDGLLHISQLSWVKVDTPNDVVSPGEEVQVKVIGINGEKISLSMKELQVNPLDNALEELKEGDVVDCRILRNESFGSFCEIKPGVEGLIPISEMLHTGRVNNPSELFKVGDVVSAQIIRIMKNERKISLSVKALKDDPWEHIEEHLKEGDEVEGVIDGLTNFGIFVRLTEGLTGLLPKSKLFRAKSKFTNEDIGKSLTMKISQIDKEKNRISLELLESDQVAGKPTRGFEPRSDNKQRVDWRKYATSKQEVPEDNPFSDL